MHTYKTLKKIESQKFTIVRDEGGLTVFPDHTMVREFLTLEYRQMIKERGRTRFDTIKEPMYQLTSVSGKAALFTYQGFWLKLKEFLESEGQKVEVIDVRVNVIGHPNLLAATTGLRNFQRKWVMKALACNNSGLLGAPTRFGKCLAPDTPVMYANGSVRRADEVRNGDLLMGPDSTPRKVIGCVSGKDQMYKITPEAGDAFVCTGDHYMVLEKCHDLGTSVVIKIDDYRKLDADEQACYRLIRRPVDFPAVSLPTGVSPYALGVELSGGYRKHIPVEFLRNSRDIRLKVLLGLIDSGGTKVREDKLLIGVVCEALVPDIMYLVRSLGLKIHATKTTSMSAMVSLWITGDLNELRMLYKNKYTTLDWYDPAPRHDAFTVSGLGEGDYYGFELEGKDRQFLLGDFTVTHNSYGMSAIARAFPNAVTVVAAPGVDLCRQLLDHFKQQLPNRDVRGVFTGSKNRTQSNEITICSFDSLDKMDVDTTELLLLDEPHAAVSDERLPKIAGFVKARKYGFGATLNGRFDKKDRLIEGLIGPVISNVTYKEGVEWGAIAPLKVIFIKIPFSKDTVPGRMVDREVVYQRLLSESKRTATVVKTIMDTVIPQNWQTMAFIRNEKQAEFYAEHAMPPWGTIAMAKRMTDKERVKVTDSIAKGETVRVLASNIYVQGLTFPDLKVVINLAGGGANTTAIQKPGRLLQCRPGKLYGVMIDFMFECRDRDQDTRTNPPYSGLVGECWARHKAYQEIGYDIEFVTDSERAREIVNSAYEQNTNN